jgi:hypothetical protein
LEKKEKRNKLTTRMPAQIGESNLTLQELATVRSTLGKLEQPVIVKVNLTNTEMSARFRKFVDEVASVSENVKPIYLSESKPGLPTIEIRPNLHYLSLPSGRELQPFLQCIHTQSNRESLLTAGSLEALEGFITPTKVEVLMSPACPNCPTVVGLVGQLALASAYLDTRITDVTLFPDQAISYGVRSVPTVIINEKEQLVGAVTEENLVDKITKRTPADFHPDTFERIVKEGDAGKLAHMMIGDEDVYPGALELLTDPDWSVRLGMMVVLEEVADSKPELVKRTYPYLMSLLDREEPNLRGDTAYLLGRIGDTHVLGRLEILTNDNNPEVAEAALEAVEWIRSRQALGNSKR